MLYGLHYCRATNRLLVSDGCEFVIIDPCAPDSLPRRVEVLPDDYTGSAGLTTLADGSILLTGGSCGVVMKLDPECRIEFEFPFRLQPGPASVTKNNPDYLSSPEDIAVDSAGRLYVCAGLDYCEKAVQQFSATGELLGHLNCCGRENRAFACPHAVVHKDGIVYVADSHRSRLQMFDTNRRFIGVIELECEGDVCDFDVLEDGTFVAAVLPHGLLRFSRDGSILTRFSLPFAGDDIEAVALGLPGEVFARGNPKQHLVVVACDLEGEIRWSKPLPDEPDDESAQT